jgi:hypothetical protein
MLVIPLAASRDHNTFNIPLPTAWPPDPSATSFYANSRPLDRMSCDKSLASKSQRPYLQVKPVFVVTTG